MPTGYTCDIERGQSFEDFVLGCARAFGACVMQRDDPSSDKPKLRSESSYHEQGLIDVQAELSKYQSMDREQQLAAGQKFKDVDIAYAHEGLNKAIALKNKYLAMLHKVNQWPPPSPDHEELKRFMMSQINESIKFDCDINYYTKEVEKAAKQTAQDYFNEKLESLERSVNYHTEGLEKERNRTAGANKWILDLYQSLGIEYQEN